MVQKLQLVVDVLHVDIHKQAKIFQSKSSMEFEIKYVTVCACDWLLFVFYYYYILYDTTYVLIIPIYCDAIKLHCLDCVGYYPASHSRHLGVNSRVFCKGTPNSPRDNTNKPSRVNGNQRSTRITLQ